MSHFNYYISFLKSWRHVCCWKHCVNRSLKGEKLYRSYTQSQRNMHDFWYRAPCEHVGLCTPEDSDSGALFLPLRLPGTLLVWPTIRVHQVHWSNSLWARRDLVVQNAVHRPVHCKQSVAVAVPLAWVLSARVSSWLTYKMAHWLYVSILVLHVYAGCILRLTFYTKCSTTYVQCIDYIMWMYKYNVRTCTYSHNMHSFMHVYIWHTYTQMYADVYIHIHICTCMHTFTHTDINIIHMHICLYAFICVHVE